jgi:hypothetical protein
VPRSKKPRRKNKIKITAEMKKGKNSRVSEDGVSNRQQQTATDSNKEYQ